MQDMEQRRVDEALELGGTLLRIGLGMLFLFAALNKFFGPGYLGFVEHMKGQFAETWLPSLLLLPFAYLLPPLELVLGALLLLGLFTRWALPITGVLLIVLAFGMALVGQHQTVFSNLGYVLMVAVAMGMLAKSNRYSLDRFFH